MRLPVAWTGLQGKIADTFNDIIAANERIDFRENLLGHIAALQRARKASPQASGHLR